MKHLGKTIAIAGCLCLGQSFNAQALPGMTAAEMTDWFRQHSSATAPQPTEKYEPDMSDFDSITELPHGEVHLSIFLNAQQQVESETIDYRPHCYAQGSPAGCKGEVQFSPRDRGEGSRLIQTTFGSAILEDFQTATLTETDTTWGVHRWYFGQLYNYETWQYDDDRTIMHFTVVSKQSPQAERIQRYRHCQENDCYEAENAEQSARQPESEVLSR